jgi:hypothetical protein
MVIALMPGTLLTQWTIRLALACYVAGLAAWLSSCGARWPRATRAVWTLGCVLFDVHVACAFHFYHRWSHAVAWQHTAERTRELLGVAVGDGIYFSYLFLVLWLLDVAWLWLAPPATSAVANGTPSGGSPAVPAPADAIAVPIAAIGSRTIPWWRMMVHVFLLFIAINGAIVFEAGPTRWAGLAACLLLGCLAMRRPTVRRGYNGLQLGEGHCETVQATSADASVG